VSDDLTIPRPAYRGARRSRGGLEPGTRRLLTIAGILASGLVVVVGGASLFGHRSGDVPVVSADDRPIRVKPENPGGLQVANANNEIFSGGSDTDGSKLAPAPEVPDPKALRTPPPAPVRPAPLAVAPPVATPVPPPAPPAATPKVAAAGASSAAPVAMEPPAVKPAPAAKPAPAQAATVIDKHAAPPLAGQHAMVQLAALTTEDAARAEWQHLEKRMPDLMGGRRPSFSRFEHDGHTFWRLRTAGFADATQARTFCERVHAKGGACSVADF
jgi:hypothetical protein